MLIKGKTIDENAIKSNTIYVIRRKREIDFLETQDNGIDDRLVILYDLLPDQYGVFVKEYRPGFIDKNRCKKADILMLVIDENAKKYSSWVFDVKVSVGGEDVIFHLLEQLKDSYNHKNSITTYLSNFEEVEHMGFITREYQRERIRQEISKREDYVIKEKETMKENPALMKFSSVKIKLIRIEKEIQVLTQFLNGYIEINNVLHSLECHMSLGNETGYVCNMKVSV